MCAHTHVSFPVVREAFLCVLSIIEGCIISQVDSGPSWEGKSLCFVTGSGLLMARFTELKSKKFCIVKNRVQLLKMSYQV